MIKQLKTLVLAIGLVAGLGLASASFAAKPKEAAPAAAAPAPEAAAPAAASGATLLGRTVKMGVPLVTLECTTVEPPNTLWVATRSADTATASVMTPEFVRTARRPAASFPSAVEATSTAVGDFSATSCASTSALGATG